MSHKCQSNQVHVSSTKQKPINQNVTSSIHPKELTINLCTACDPPPLDQESDRYLRETCGHPVGFLVPMLVL